MDVTNLSFQSQVFLALTILAASIFFLGVLPDRRSDQSEAPLRYHVSPPEAVKSAYQARPSETSTCDVCACACQIDPLLTFYSLQMAAYTLDVLQMGVPSVLQ